MSTNGVVLQSHYFLSHYAELQTAKGASFIAEDDIGWHNLEYYAPKVGDVLYQIAFMEQEPGCGKTRQTGCPTLIVGNTCLLMKQCPTNPFLWVCEEVAGSCCAYLACYLGMRAHCPGRVLVQWILFGNGNLRIMLGDSLGRSSFRFLDLHPRVLLGDVEEGSASPCVDSLIWSPSYDHFQFAINSHMRQEVTPALTACVRHGVFGEFRDGLCVMPIGLMPPDKLTSWHIARHPWCALRRMWLACIARARDL